MEVGSASHGNHYHVPHWRYVNLEAECLRDRLAIKQQLGAVRRSGSLRVQMLAVAGPLRASGDIRHNLSVAGELVMVLITGRADGQSVCKVLPVRADCD